MVEHHTCKGTKLVCNVCTQQGYSAGHPTGYTCTVCCTNGEKLGHNKFDKMLLDNSKKQTGSILKCIDCASKLPCAACQVPFEKTFWTGRERNKLQQHDRILVCKACRDLGCDPADTHLYKCQGCDNSFGHQKFEKNIRKNKVGPNEFRNFEQFQVEHLKNNVPMARPTLAKHPGDGITLRQNRSTSHMN